MITQCRKVMKLAIPTFALAVTILAILALRDAIRERALNERLSAKLALISVTRSLNPPVSPQSPRIERHDLVRTGSAVTTKPIDLEPVREIALPSADEAIHKDRHDIEDRYAELFRSLKLSPEAETKLEDYLADRDNIGLQVREAMQSQGVAHDKNLLEASIASEVNEVNDRIRSLIGTDGFEQLLTFEKNAMLSLGKGSSAPSGTP